MVSLILVYNCLICFSIVCSDQPKSEQSSTCSVPQTLTTRIQIMSSRNEAKQWKFQIGLDHDGGSSDEKKIGPWLVDTTHTVKSTCEGEESVHILADLQAPRIPLHSSIEPTNIISVPIISNGDVTIPKTQFLSSTPTTSKPLVKPPPAPTAQPPTIVPTPKAKHPTGTGYEIMRRLGYYKFHARGVPWSRAREICAEEGTHLIVINSGQEVEIVQTLFSRHLSIPSAEQNDFVWTGVNEIGENGKYFTVFGNPLESTGFATWIPSEPNDPGAYDCVLTHRTAGFLADAGCERLFGFICELSIPTGIGYEFMQGLGYYKFYAKGVTWSHAQQICAEDGTHLIIINSKEEAEIVKTLFSRHETIPGAEQTGWVWTGVRELGENGKYFTLFGNPLQSTGFATWHHDHDPGTNDCVLTHRIDAFLADAACERLFGFICELGI